MSNCPIPKKTMVRWWTFLLRAGWKSIGPPMTEISPLLSLPDLRASGVPEPWAFGRRGLGPVRRDRLAGACQQHRLSRLVRKRCVWPTFIRSTRPPYPKLQTVIKSLTAEFRSGNER